LPISIPFSTIEAATLRKTFPIILSVIPIDLSVPMVEMFLNNMIRRPEIMLNPATIVISTRMKSTLKSIKSSQSKIAEYLSITDVATRVSSSSSISSRRILPASAVTLLIEYESLEEGLRATSIMEISSESQPLRR
jgi:hypothetical protein